MKKLGKNFIKGLLNHPFTFILLTALIFSLLVNVSFRNQLYRYTGRIYGTYSIGELENTKHIIIEKDKVYFNENRMISEEENLFKENDNLFYTKNKDGIQKVIIQGEWNGKDVIYVYDKALDHIETFGKISDVSLTVQ